MYHIRKITQLTIIFLFILHISTGCRNGPAIEVATLKCNNKESPAGVGREELSFSWQMSSDQRNQWQTAWQIVLAESEKALEEGKYFWNSGKNKGKNNLHIPYQGPELEAASRYHWRVRVWDRDGISSEWSQTATFVTGLFGKADWEDARWIAYETLPDSMKIVPGIHGSGSQLGTRGKRRPVVPRFRYEFQVDNPVKEAFLFITGLGHYEARLNGKKIGDRFLSPGWTDYRETVLYNIYEITEQVQHGSNAIGVTVGNGFYNVNRERYRKLVIAYGMPKMLCQLRLRYRDGSTETMVSGPDWQTTASPITYSSIFGGEDYDARLDQPGWDEPEFDGEGWKSVKIAEPSNGKLRAQQSHPVKISETLAYKKVNQPEPGIYLYDFGQNASGIPRIKVKGKKGQQIRLTPSELLHDNGLANQDASGKPHYYTYTLKGDGVEIWHPKFTYYGFRYVQVEGAVPDSVSDDNKPGIVNMEFLHNRNSAPGTGHFETSYEPFNDIYSLIKWAIKSNLQSVMTDCPHREKLGWLEQTHLMGGSVHYNYHLHHLYNKQIADMMDSQTNEGLVPDIAPEYVEFIGGFRDSPEWGSASVILPWLLYKWYGDEETIRKAWPMMDQYVNYLKSKADNHILSHGLGDWYDLGPNPPGQAQLTPKAVTATAIYYYDVKLLSQMARVIDKTEEAERYTQWAGEIQDAFQNRFFDSTAHVYSTGSQTAMAMPLVTGLVKESDRQEVLSNLEDSIRANNKALTAGDVGFHFLVEALENGEADQLLFEMNARSDVPGYGYQLKKGATALTESWAALEEVSNNHLMLGHIMEWFYEGLAGIRQTPSSAAYNHILIEPAMVGDIEWTKAWYESPNGRIQSEWSQGGEQRTMKVSIPVNTTATVVIPSIQIDRITESGTQISNHPDILEIRSEEEDTRLRLGSGNYVFKFPK